MLLDDSLLKIMRFHRYHGENIQLLRGGTVAYRRSSFANSIAFGEKPLKPYELFLLEINNNENGWSGHLRVGLTLLNPETRPPLPLYALPELNDSGSAWISAITRPQTINRVYHDGFNNDVELDFPQERASVFDMLGVEDLTRRLDSINGNNDSRVANSDQNNLNGQIRLPTDVGSQIGVYYRVGTDNRTAEMHFVINGVDQGPSAADIPYNGTPIYAIVDVYGTTKQVQIVQPVQAGKYLLVFIRIFIRQVFISSQWKNTA